MDYLLVVLTHGRGDTLPQTLASFGAMVTPEPADSVLIEDGAPLAAEWFDGPRVSLGGNFGFCAAVAAGWREAANTGHEFVFWLEHDFIFTRPVDLSKIAYVLSKNTQLAQMSLMRQPVNADEIERGGVLVGHAHQRVADFLGDEWIEHSAYFTTNPSLFPSQLARDHVWPEGPACEGKLGIELREAGYSFGVWGHDVQHVEHIGNRTGKGY